MSYTILGVKPAEESSISVAGITKADLDSAMRACLPDLTCFNTPLSREGEEFLAESVGAPMSRRVVHQNFIHVNDLIKLIDSQPAPSCLPGVRVEREYGDGGEDPDARMRAGKDQDTRLVPTEEK